MLGWTRMKDELLLRLESFELDKPGASFPFSARLARDRLAGDSPKGVTERTSTSR